MWTSTLDLDPKRVLITQLLRRVWPGVSFSSFAPLQVQNLPRQPLPEKTWVRVRNRLSGICGSDLHMVQGDGDFRIAPAALPLHRRSYPGHEVVGEVLEVGEDVQHIRVGNRVVLQYGPNCLSANVQTPCRSCAQGYYNLCEHGKLPGPHSIGGGWSEEMLLSEQQLFRLPTDISDEQAVLLEPTAVAIHAVLRRLPQQDERVLIIGAGTIGLLTLQIVHALAPRAEVSVMARHSFQIEQATRLGATHIIYPQDGYTGIQRATNAQIYKGAFGNQMLLGGYDVIFDTVGSQKTLHHALRWARAQATVVLVGINLRQMRIDLTPVWYQEVNLIGSMSSSIETWPPVTNERHTTFDVAVELIKQDQIHPERLITHRFPLNNYQTALLTAAGKAQSRAIKVVFDYSLLPPSVVPNVRASATRKRRSLPIDESTSTPENQNVAEDISSPTELTEPALPAASLSSLFSSSHTVAPPQYEDDEFDEMEDTIPSPAIATFDRQAPAPQRQKVQDAWLEEHVTTLPILPFMSISPNSDTSSPDSETTPSGFIEQDIPQGDDILPEIATGTNTPESIEHKDETPETDSISTVGAEEPSETTDDIVQPAYEAPETLIETTQDSKEAFAFLPLPTQEMIEHSEAQPYKVTQAIPEASEQSTDTHQDDSEPSEAYAVDTYQDNYESSELYDEFDTYQDNSDPSEAYDVDVYQDNPEPSEIYTREVSSSPSETSEESATQFDAFEYSDPFTPFNQDALSSANFTEEEKTDIDSATEDTENALLPTERVPIVKAQNRPRSRTRKKNNHISVEKR